MVKAAVTDIWQHREQAASQLALSAKVEVSKIEREIEQALDRLVEISNSSVTARLEERITKLENEKLVWAEKAQKIAMPQRSFKETLRTALTFLSNPQKLWASDDLADRQICLRLTFAKRLSFTRNGGLRTPELSLPFKLLGAVEGGQNMAFGEMAHWCHDRSNTLWKELADWEDILKDCNIKEIYRNDNPDPKPESAEKIKKTDKRAS